MLVDSRTMRGWVVVTVGVLAVAVFAFADALGFGYDGFGLVQFLGVVGGLIVVAFGGLLIHRRRSGSDPELRRFGRILIGAIVGLTLALSSVVLWGIWERAGDLDADQIAWCGDRGPEMYEAAVELELVTVDEVIDLLLNSLQNDPGFLGPRPTREETLRLFETEPATMQRIAATFWWRDGVEPGGEVYRKACKEAYATASIEGFVALPGDTVNCDFDTPAEAQEWYDTWFPRYGDVARLDRDGDGVPCEDAGWHIDLKFGLAPDNVTHGVEWGPDTRFSDMRSGDSCASGGPWVPPEPDFPFSDITVAIYGNPSFMVRFSFPTLLSPRGAWVHLADGTCLAADEEGNIGGGDFYQFDDALPEFGRTVP